MGIEGMSKGLREWFRGSKWEDWIEQHRRMGMCSVTEVIYRAYRA